MGVAEEEEAEETVEAVVAVRPRLEMRKLRRRAVVTCINDIRKMHIIVINPLLALGNSSTNLNLTNEKDRLKISKIAVKLHLFMT